MEKNKENSLLVILVCFLCTLFVYKDFGIRYFWGYLFLLLPIVHVILKKKVLRINALVQRTYLLILLAVFFSYFRLTARIDKDTALYLITMILCFMFACFIKTNINQFKKVEKIVLICSYMCSFLVILSRVAREVYLSTFYKMLTAESQDIVYYSLWHGYSCTIGGDDTFHNYMFMIAMVLSLGHIAENKRSWLKYYFQSLYFVIASFLTGRRGEFLVLLFIWLFVGFYIMPKKQRKHLLAVGTLFVICIIPLLPDLVFNSLFFSRFLVTIEQLNTGGDFLSGRLELWDMAIDAFLEHPFFGIGWGGFANLLSDSFRATHGNVYNAHNVYLQLLAETGFVGFSMIMTGLLALLYHTFKQTNRLRFIHNDYAVLRRLNGMALGIQVYFLLLSLMDPCFMKYYYWCYFTIALVAVNMVDIVLKKHGS